MISIRIFGIQFSDYDIQFLSSSSVLRLIPGFPVVCHRSLETAAASVPAGTYGVAVSGGADSVALLHLLHHRRPDLSVHVIHLDHQSRGHASTGDAAFVRQLAVNWGLRHTIALRCDVEPHLRHRPANRSALYRALRLELFRRVVAEAGLSGVLLAHHADDQAETILHRLLRGSGAAGLRGMATEAELPGVRLFRPLLGVRGKVLREYLSSVDQPWREDASNASDQYLRNRLRRLLSEIPDLLPALIDLGGSCAGLRAWVVQAAPKLPETFCGSVLQGVPSILASEAVRTWLVSRSAPPGEIDRATVERLIEMALDAASPPRQHFPGGLLVRRRRGLISLASASAGRST